MLSPPHSFRMLHTTASSQNLQICIFISTVITGIFVFFASFIELVLALSHPKRMSHTDSCCQAHHINILIPTILTIKTRHNKLILQHLLHEDLNPYNTNIQHDTKRTHYYCIKSLYSFLYNSGFWNNTIAQREKSSCTLPIFSKYII